jgi:hypothetical protein
MANLFDRLLKDVEVKSSTDYDHSETKYGEDSDTGKPVIYVNPDQYPEGSASRDKMIKGEALHLLKLKEPKLHKDLMDTALKDPEYMKAARHSFDVVRGLKPDEEGNYVPEERREKRDFDKWHTVSRFDQVMGGYILAGDKDIPTMKNWNRDNMRMGPELRRKMEVLAKEFNYEKPRLDEKPKQQQRVPKL